MAHPTMHAPVGDVAHPTSRASPVGVYRLWRDLGFAVGGLLTAAVGDLAGMPVAIWTIAALTALSGLVVAIRTYETCPAL